ncbi:hypothetical protein FHS79_001525 [Polymorphobacter multimanifer]|uniref:Class I SAM-dependent methyltransferase n=1 Tax=Polymorphobacter multimanifer TaxID=1070431 RepID=A0A841L3E9_9SPHN|nr:class I SAM-dependent methyltransferase [Polymorphobacter multimanifer]MBB6227359.1 hypothetical protein [Polymorphobacter multimanifer]
MSVPTAPAACRLCGGDLNPRFTGTLLGRHKVGYLACAGCGSLQTEPPHWLAEAYANNLADLDTGAAQRCFVNMGASHLVARLFGLGNILDFGGGDGLHARLLRDHGLNAFVEDAHARPGYAQGFDAPDFTTPDLVTAFEVMEHFANPAEDLAQIFGRGARAVLASTTRWHGEGANWWYLTPSTGQHIFFYSDAAIDLIARRFGYTLVARGNYLLFVQPALATPARIRLARLMLRSRLPRLWASLVQMRQPTGGDADWQALSRRDQE